MRRLTKLYGPPGTGKTTELLRMMEDANRLGFFAFTRAAAKEARERLGKGRDNRMTTIHALCYHELGLSHSQVMDATKLKDFARVTGIPCEGKNTFGAETVAPGDSALEAIHKARSMCVPLHAVPTDEPYGFVAQVAEQYGIYKERNGLLDFDDMLDRFVEAHTGDLQLDDLFVDEGQDLSPLQWRVIRHIAQHVVNVVIAGDDDQCQPAGTMVDTPKGAEPIESLRDGDQVVAWCAPKHYFAARRVRTASRRYTGDMFTVNAGGKTTRATAEHLWVARWVFDPSVCVTYVMRRGSNYRVGWCQLFRADGCLHLNVRANLEKADAVWVVGVHTSRTDASVRESVVSAKYGIPTVTFEPVNGAQHLTREAIDAIFAQVPGEAGALRLFADMGLHVDQPLIDRTARNFSARGGKDMLVASRNLLPGQMVLPVRAGKSVEWHHFNVAVSPSDEPVYSLDVEQDHTYVANGIVTHNCIYPWAGADPQGMAKFGGRAKTRVLGQSHRIPSAVHDLAHDIIARVPDRVEKPYKPREERGTVRRYGDLTYAPRPTERTLVLFRNHGTRAEVVEWLTAIHPMPFLGEGSPFQGKWAVAARAWKRLQDGREVEKGHMDLLVRCAPDLGPRVKAGDMSWVRHDPLVAMDRMPEATRAYLGRVDLEAEPTVRISTIHASKGAEADRVVLMAGMGERTWADMDVHEHRVWYVGVTRAKHVLDIIDGPNAYTL